MKSQRVGYVRVSTAEQNDERQLDGIDLDRVFIDRASGKDMDRPQLQAALAYVRDGDTLTVHSMDRLARSVEDILRMVRELNAKGVVVQFVKENMTFEAGTDDPRSVLMFTMLSAFSQFERAIIRERQKEGIALAKAKGVYKGRAQVVTPEMLERIENEVRLGVPKSRAAQNAGISRQTLYNYYREKREHRQVT